MFGFLYSVYNALYICAGGLVIAEMGAGPLISAALIAINAFVFANPYHQAGPE